MMSVCFRTGTFPLYIPLRIGSSSCHVKDTTSRHLSTTIHRKLYRKGNPIPFKQNHPLPKPQRNGARNRPRHPKGAVPRRGNIHDGKPWRERLRGDVQDQQRGRRRRGEIVFCEAGEGEGERGYVSWYGVYFDSFRVSVCAWSDVEGQAVEGCSGRVCMCVSPASEREVQ